MIFRLLRKENTASYCMGRLYAAVGDATSALPPDEPEFYICDTLEPPVLAAGQRTPTGGKGAVAAGRYDLALTRSPRFGRVLPVLVDVPGRTGIRIHRGNLPSDTSGCILPGHYVGGGRLEISTVMELDIIRILMDSRDPSCIEIIDDFRPAAAQALSVEADRSPTAPTSPIEEPASQRLFLPSGLLTHAVGDLMWGRPGLPPEAALA